MNHKLTTFSLHVDTFFQYHYFSLFLASKFGRIAQQEVNIDEEGNRFRSDFNTFITRIVSGLSERRDQEEVNIMNTKN